MLGVGGMIGSAIFIFPGETGVLAGASSILAWLLAGLLMMAVSMVYIKLAVKYPESGGPVLYPYYAFKSSREVAHLLSFLEGAGFFVGWLICVVISSLCIPSYISYAIAPVNSYLGKTVIALSSIALVAAVNMIRVRRTGFINTILTSFVLAGIILFISTGVVHGVSHPQISFSNLKPKSISGFLASIAIAVSAYGAWVGIASIAGEVRDPERTVKRGILLSLTIVTSAYTLVVLSIHLNTPLSLFKPSSPIIYSPVSYTASLISRLRVYRVVIALTAITSIVTTMIVGVMSLSRALYALSTLGLAPKAFASLSSSKVPAKAVLAVAVASGVLALFPSLFFKMIVVGLVIGTIMPYAINIASYISVEYRSSGLKAIANAAIALTVLVITGLNLSLKEVKASLVTLAIISALYFLSRKTVHE